MPKPKGMVADVLSPSGGRSGGGGPCGGSLYHCCWAVDEGGLQQTLARSGSTKTEPFHGLHLHPVHEEGPLHYGAKAEIERTA